MKDRLSVWLLWILLFVPFVILPTMAIRKAMEEYEFSHVLQYSLGVCFATAFLYWADKRKARRGNWRISEGTLHISEFFGGWLIAYWMQRFIWHKIRKGSYQAEFWFIGIVQQYFMFDYLYSWKHTKIIFDILSRSILAK